VALKMEYFAIVERSRQRLGDIVVSLFNFATDEPGRLPNKGVVLGLCIVLVVWDHPSGGR